MKDINQWTRKEFLALPELEWNAPPIEYDSLVILPMNYNHDSGFKCMDFVAVQKGIPVCRLSGGSDVLHLNGIGGYGQNWLQTYNTVPDKVTPIAWSIDCLRTSKLLRLFSHNKLTNGNALSSFEVYAILKKEEQAKESKK